MKLLINIKSKLNTEFKITPKEYISHLLLWTFSFGSVSEMNNIFYPTEYQYYWFGYVHLLMALLFSGLFILELKNVYEKNIT